jgi:hypothetical protein
MSQDAYRNLEVNVERLKDNVQELAGYVRLLTVPTEQVVQNLRSICRNSLLQEMRQLDVQIEECVRRFNAPMMYINWEHYTARKNSIIKQLAQLT